MMRVCSGIAGGLLLATGASAQETTDANVDERARELGGVRVAEPLTRCVRGAILNHMVQYSIDSAFGALADPTRRGILQILGRGDASITELALRFDMTLTGMKKHVQILEDAGLVESRKVGRVRICRLGPRRLELEAEWIEAYRQMVEERFNRLEAFLERTRGEP